MSQSATANEEEKKHLELSEIREESSSSESTFAREVSAERNEMDGTEFSTKEVCCMCLLILVAIALMLYMITSNKLFNNGRSCESC